MSARVIEPIFKEALEGVIETGGIANAGGIGIDEKGGMKVIRRAILCMYHKKKSGWGGLGCGQDHQDHLGQLGHSHARGSEFGAALKKRRAS